MVEWVGPGHYAVTPTRVELSWAVTIISLCGREVVSTIIKDLMVKDYSPQKEKGYQIATIWFICSLVI
jgi:hypothetical protein